MNNPRLSRDTWNNLPSDISAPSKELGAMSVGQVHLGLGAFHRAHQAVYTEDAALARGENNWGIVGVTQRSDRVARQLNPQDGLYGVLTKGKDETSLRVMGIMQEALFPGEQTEAVLNHIAASRTHVVTLTVTEKGYRRRADGGLDVDREDLGADLEQLRAELKTGQAQNDASQTPIGMLLRGLARRFRDHGAPINVVCCDNLTDNGTVVAQLVAQGAQFVGHEKFSAWIAESVAFPSTMVDRIVPATAESNFTEAEQLSGLVDEGLVVGEPFAQWVIEDKFSAPRPAWEVVGAQFTDDVAPYEKAKLWILNGSHSTLAYLGALRGHGTISDAIADPVVHETVMKLTGDDVLPQLIAPQGMELNEYRDQVIDRFANPNTGHTTIQVAMDGSQKIPVRLLPTVRANLDAGRIPEAAARAVGAWMGYVRAISRGELNVDGNNITLDDPMADQLLEAASGSVADQVDRTFAMNQIFDEQVAGHDGFRAAVSASLTELTNN